MHSLEEDKFLIKLPRGVQSISMPVKMQSRMFTEYLLNIYSNLLSMLFRYITGVEKNDTSQRFLKIVFLPLY